jgi:hypothetical protein
MVGVYREPIAAGETDSKYRWFRSYTPREMRKATDISGFA